MKFKEQYFTPCALSSASLILSLIAILCVVADGLTFYRSTFLVAADKIDICSGTRYQDNFTLIAVVALVLVMPIGVFAIVFSVMNRAKQQVIIALIVVILSLSPFPTGQFINEQIITHRTSAFTLDGCESFNTGRLVSRIGVTQ